MKTLYLECRMGAAGDMLNAALFELLNDDQQAEYLEKMNNLGLPGIHVEAQEAVRCGITGTHMAVTIDGQEEGELHHHHHEHEHKHDHEHHHEHHHDHEHEHGHHHHHGGTLHDMEHILGHMDIPEAVHADALAVFHQLAGAESRVHGMPLTEIHFHEVGTLDAAVDIVGACLLIHQLSPERIVASPVHVGSGTVHCAHGILAVPAPATAVLLEGIPCYGGEVDGELCTPTGAALLRHFVSQFGPMPLMTTERIGSGMGMKEFDHANCLRAFWGESGEVGRDEIVELRCNLDDMTGEDIACAVEVLMDAGALDAFTAPITMKKGRPAVLLTCLCREDDREKMSQLLLRHTTTLGVRESICRRWMLERSEETKSTSLGTVRVKTSTGHGICRKKAELEDLKAIAKKKGLSLEEVRRVVEKEI